MKLKTLLTLALLTSFAQAAPKDYPSLSGIYPHLAYFNKENECGTGAVVPWADRLWVITYAPHAPSGSTDKLYEITPELKLITRPESIGGTPANRMIHKESDQLFIGPYAIDSKRNVRAIPYTEMYGRHTGLARHLTDPSGKIVFATMEEGFYEVDVKTLKPTELFRDYQIKTASPLANLPGNHGKGFYSGQGVYVYSNNGNRGNAARKRPDIPAGCLAEWDGKSEKWTLIRRNQFTEVTGPGGIHGNKNPATDPIWAVGWDYRSLILGVRMPGKTATESWTFYRLPKGSHSYDGAHGWNTEWPRIRKIGEGDYLMTMHGTFWKFPKTFTPKKSSGIIPRSNFLKVTGDFARWGDHIVIGCDDAAKAEFLNKRKAKGHIAAPQSQSNLWFVKPDQLDHFGPVIGRGAVWEKDPVKANQPSDPYMFSGYDIRGLHLSHEGENIVTFSLEVDKKGDGNWTPLKQIKVGAKGYVFTEFSLEETGTWVRISSNADLPKATAAFSYRNNDHRSEQSDKIFNGLAKNNDLTGGLVRSRGGDRGTLVFAACDPNGNDIGHYELGADLKLRHTDDKRSHTYTKNRAAISIGALSVDAASVVYTDDDGNRWRLPKAELTGKHPLGAARIAREVATERDLLNAYGTFYEFPARNAGGISKLRAVATHNSFVHDFCSFRGLFIMSGIATNAPKENPHIIYSDDGKTSLWAGAIDDIWKLGKPHGTGGPWKDTTVKTGQPSEPYLMTGYDKKSLILSASGKCTITAQIDLTGTGHWVDYKAFMLEADSSTDYAFPEGFQAYWIRFISDQDATVTAQLSYK